MLIILQDWILWWVWSERTLLTVHHHHYYHHHHHHQPHHHHNHHHHQHHHHRSGFCDAERRDPSGCAIWASSPVLWFSVLHNPRTSALPHIIIIIARSLIAGLRPAWPRVDRRALLRIKIAKNDLLYIHHIVYLSKSIWNNLEHISFYSFFVARKQTNRHCIMIYISSLSASLPINYFSCRFYRVTFHWAPCSFSTK